MLARFSPSLAVGQRPPSVPHHVGLSSGKFTTWHWLPSKQVKKGVRESTQDGTTVFLKLNLRSDIPITFATFCWLEENPRAPSTPEEKRSHRMGITGDYFKAATSSRTSIQWLHTATPVTLCLAALSCCTHTSGLPGAAQFWRIHWPCWHTSHNKVWMLVEEQPAHTR